MHVHSVREKRESKKRGDRTESSASIREPQEETAELQTQQGWRYKEENPKAHIGRKESVLHTSTAFLHTQLRFMSGSMANWLYFYLLQIYMAAYFPEEPWWILTQFFFSAPHFFLSPIFCPYPLSPLHCSLQSSDGEKPICCHWSVDQSYWQCLSL